MSVFAFSVAHAGEELGMVVAVLCAFGALLAGGRPELRRARAAALLAALALTPVLLGAGIWDTSKVRALRHHPLLLVVAALAVVLAICALAFAIRRRAELFPLLAVAALPFRVPIATGAGGTSKLLLPLYAVIAAAVLAYSVPLLWQARHGVVGDSEVERGPRAGALEVALGVFVGLYVLQAAYSSGFTTALENVSFFYVPFALLAAMLRELRWEWRLLTRALAVTSALAVGFALVGFVEYATKHLLLNPASSKAIESYFRVNSLFYDPNIFGRYLALVMVLLAAALLWRTRSREVLAIGALIAVLWLGLMTSVSQTSVVALLLGLVVLGAARWSPRVIGVGALVFVVLAAALVAFDGSAVHFNLSNSQAADNSTSGRFTLVQGGIDLFDSRPFAGHGSGSFEVAYRRASGVGTDAATSASHTIPVTVAAEQGVIGLLAYVALVVCAFLMLLGGDVRRSPARIAVAAAFVALLAHTMAYADFLEDPITWTLLAVGGELAWWQSKARGTAGADALAPA